MVKTLKRALRRHHIERLRRAWRRHYHGNTSSMPTRGKEIGRIVNTATLCSCALCDPHKQKGVFWKNRRENYGNDV
jgi:hypothetical protein